MRYRVKTNYALVSEFNRYKWEIYFDYLDSSLHLDKKESKLKTGLIKLKMISLDIKYEVRKKNKNKRQSTDIKLFPVPLLFNHLKFLCHEIGQTLKWTSLEHRDAVLKAVTKQLGQF